MCPPFLKVTAALIALAGLATAPLAAQTARSMGEVNEAYRNAVELYQKKLYGLAQPEFERALTLGLHGVGEAYAVAAEYYILECACEQRSSNAESLIGAFMERYAGTPRQNDAFYLLAKLYFRESRYGEAVDMFERFESSALSRNDYQEYAFKKAYSLFVERRYEEASPLFASVKDGGSKYAAAATYYYAHIAYEQQRYAVALEGFESLRDDEVFARMAPYYIMHIHHHQHSYDKVIAEGEALVEGLTGKRLPEVSRLIGEAYYYQKQYEKALPHIEKFAETAPALTRSDKYLLGYIYYQNKRYPNAARMFEQIVVGKDSLAQSAYYYLADALLQQGDKQKAGRAFLQASKMSFFPEVKEDAMFSYAKLMFEVNSGPFNDAIEALNAYLKAYPSSRRSDEVNKCLMQAYLYSKNYAAALSSLQAIAHPDANALAAMQKVAYFRAVTLLRDKSYEEAMALFDLSLKHAAYDATVAALATYWKAETAYRLSRYALAQQLFNEALLSAGIVQAEEYKMAHYGLGYSLFKQQRYAEAEGWFRKYAALGSTSAPTSTLCDAYNRIGDCYFMQRMFEQAVESYRVVVRLNTTDADYAALQCGLCYGLLDTQDLNIGMMNQVINATPPSPYADYALYEKGRCLVQMQRYDEAVALYSQLLEEHRGSAFYAKALIELGLISVNRGDAPKALTYYKRVASDYQGTFEARSALLGIKNIYTEMGDAEAYFRFLSGMNLNVNAAEKDSMTFSVAENAYATGSSKATSLLLAYLKEFPKGAFVVDANYFMGDCLQRLGKPDEALPYFEAVVASPKNTYTEPSLQSAAKSLLAQGRYEKAAALYEQLLERTGSKATLVEARLGKLRADYLNADYATVITDAEALLATENLPDELHREIYFKRAKAYEQLNMQDKALADYTVAAQDMTTLEGAEAQQRVVALLFAKGQLDKAEQEVFRFSKSGTTHQRWMAKSFITLGDIYVKRGDAFQAKATYESILDGYKEEHDGSVVDEVRARIQQLVATEKEKEESVELPRPDDIAL
jgi:tetratricopeptide (TPR) repeat protein